MKKEPPSQNTDKRLPGSSPGNIEWVLGLFAVTLMALLAQVVLETFRYRAASDALEDALGLCALAAAVIDLKEYGTTHSIRIDDPLLARERYLDAMKINLGLGEDFVPPEDGLICGPVTLEDFRIYQVSETDVTEIRVGAGGEITQRSGLPGSIRTPEGQEVTVTGIYGKVSFPVESIRGIRVQAEKSKLAGVVRNTP